MFLQYLLLEFILISVAGLSCFWGNKGILTAGLILSTINIYYKYPSTFWQWEMIILGYLAVGIIGNLIFNRKTDHLRVLKVSAGSVAALFSSGLFLPLIPGFIAWTFTIALPLLFTYRQIPKTLYLQIIFKFIFSTGWLIIGNILY